MTLPRDSIQDWKAFEANNIPTKGIKLPPLFEKALKAAQAEGKQAANELQILELGCGCGELALHLSEQGHTLVGVDVNENAIALAQDHNKFVDRCRFFVDDVTTLRMSKYTTSHDGVDKHFDFCILQLLLSIVGNVANRRQSITTAYQSLKKGGYLYLSCSGVSDAINSNYKELYEQDYPATQEMYTYYSRDANGNILYTTHHFTAGEIIDLLRDVGFEDVRVQEVQERSSRRPEEAANFLYVMARKL